VNGPPSKPMVPQRGFILPFALLFLALTAATAVFGPRLAALELARSSAADARGRADLAAATALQLARETVELSSTVPALLISRDRAGSSARVESAFLGFRMPPGGDGTLLEWHFHLTATGTSTRGARSVHRQQVSILAPAPPDPAGCLDPGCEVPPICRAGEGCVADLRSPAAVVTWSMPENP
jgi:hypothetical protein